MNCTQPSHEGVPAVFILLDEKKIGTGRGVCTQCIEEGLFNSYSRLIDVNQVQKYVHKEIESVNLENRVEKQLPINKKLKKICIEKISSFHETSLRNNELLNIFFTGLREDIANKIKLGKERGFQYCDQIQTILSELKQSYRDVYDFSELQQLIKKDGTDQEINQKTNQFFYEKFDSKNYSQVLENRNINLKNILNQYTPVFYTNEKESALFYCDQISFNRNQQKDEPFVKRESVKNVKEKAHAFFNYDNSGLSSPFSIEQNDDESQILTTSSMTYWSLAKLNITLKPEEYYQAIFKIEIVDQMSFLSDFSEFILIGVVSNKIMKISTSDIKYSLVISGKKSYQGCSLSQYGQDLSIPNEGEQFLVMNICLSRNVFYFSNKQKVSRNIMPDGVSFNSKEPMQLIVGAKGKSIKITFVKLQLKEKQNMI